MDNINKTNESVIDNDSLQEVIAELNRHKGDTDYRRVLSGKTFMVKTKCPECDEINTKEIKEIEVEHLEEPESWRIQGCIVIACPKCQARRDEHKRAYRASHSDEKGA
jgi:ssDNA-binding Zn-finger/Zn-ribbon topoisomerase 1